MTESSFPPSREDRVWSAGLQAVWRTASVSSESHLDPSVLAAYAEQNLAEDIMLECEEHLSLCPECLALVRQLWESLDERTSDVSPVPAARPSRSRTAWAWWYSLAMSLLVGIGGWLWGWHESIHSRRLDTAVAGLDRQLTDTRLELVLAYKESLLDLSPSPVRSYWVMAPSPRILQMPQARGLSRLSPEALMIADKARQSLRCMLDSPKTRGSALLELASIEIAAGRKEEAGSALQEAQAVLGDTPEVENLRAVCLLAQGDKDSIHQAEEILRGLNRSQPGYLPAWYNLALLLKQSFCDTESRQAWEEYLRREQRPEFRQAAMAQMSAM